LVEALVKRVQRTRVLDDAADVVEGSLGQPGVAVAGKDVVAVLGDGLVHVHAGAVVTDQRLGHEGGGLAIGMRHVVHAVLEDLYLVGLLDQRVELDADLALAGGTHLVVMHFDRQAHLLHGRAHGRADVVQRVHRRHGK
jgi:hypothetical protein